jgi:hypothetical protein
VRVCGKAGQEARLFVANTTPLALALALGARRPVSVPSFSFGAFSLPTSDRFQSLQSASVPQLTVLAAGDGSRFSLF